MEDKADTTKDAFYDKLEVLYNRCHRSERSYFWPNSRENSLHEKTSDNGFRLVSFADTQSKVISNTRFQHRNIHKATWQSPVLNTKNQIDSVVIDGRHASSIFDVNKLRGANSDASPDLDFNTQ